jgi:hypothetical protein
MWGPKYGTDFGYGTDERGVGLTYMYHSLDFDRLRNERTDKPGSIVIDTYRDASGATVYEPVSSKFYDLVPFEAQDYYKGFYETGFTFKNNISVSGNNGKILHLQGGVHCQSGIGEGDQFFFLGLVIHNQDLPGAVDKGICIGQNAAYDRILSIRRFFL